MNANLQCRFVGSSRPPAPSGTARGRACIVVVAVPFATWFLVGYLAEEGGTDHIFEAPQLGRPVEILLGTLVALIALTAGWGFLGRFRSWLVDDGWWRVYSRLLACGVFVAVGGRIVTAGSSGANIGGGGIMLVGPVVVVYLVARARAEAVRIRSAGVSGWMPSPAEWVIAGFVVMVADVLVALLTARR